MPYLAKPNSIKEREVSINDAIPLNGLPIGVSVIVTTDAYVTDNVITIPDDVKWLNFSGTADFIVAYHVEDGSAFLPLPTAGNPLTATGQVFPEQEVNPGLRRLYDGEDRQINVRGITAAGLVTVSYYR